MFTTSSSADNEKSTPAYIAASDVCSTDNVNKDKTSVIKIATGISG